MKFYFNLPLNNNFRYYYEPFFDPLDDNKLGE